TLSEIEDALTGPEPPSLDVAFATPRKRWPRSTDAFRLRMTAEDVSNAIARREWALVKTPRGHGDLELESASGRTISVSNLPPGVGYVVQARAYPESEFEHVENPEEPLTTLFGLDVRPPFEPRITLEAREATVGSELTFSGTGSRGDIERYEWHVTGPRGPKDSKYNFESVEDLDDPEGTGPQTTHEFDVTGTYEVSLTVWEDNNQPFEVTAEARKRFEIVPGENGDGTDRTFDVSIDAPDTVTQHETVTLSGSVEWSPSSVVDWEWRGPFEDPEFGKVTSHAFPDPGTVDVELVATNADGDTATATKRIEVEAAARPSVRIDGPSSVREGAVAEYEVQASVETGEVVEYSWGGAADAEDVVAGSDGQRATVPFVASGTATVVATATSDAGLVGRDTQRVTVRADLSDNEGPSVSIDAPDAVPVGSRRTLRADASDPDGIVVEYDWGGDAEGKTGESIEMTFDSAITYDVSVSVEDDDGATATASTQIAAVPKPPAENEPPDVEIDGPSQVLEGNSAEFVADVADENGVVSYDWNVGGQSKVVSTSFDGTGEQTVTVTVADTWGAEGSASHTVTVRPNLGEFEGPRAVISMPDTVNTTVEETFDAGDSEGDIASYEWELAEVQPFGSNATVPLEDPTGETLTHTRRRRATR
ncbi:MAG: PKD domain-containing protein, partial [Halorientalis sp.]